MVAEPPTGTSTAQPPTNEPEQPRQRRHHRAHSLLVELLLTLLLAFLLFIVISFALQTVRVDGPSMKPTLYGDDGAGHDILFADKLSYRLHAPNRGDIVILQPPAQLNTDFIKRVVGLPGDTVEIVPKGYNGPELHGIPAARPEVLVKAAGSSQLMALDEPYLADQSKDPWTNMTSCCRSDNGTASDAPNPFTVPRDEFFVMGDNRNASLDSRSPEVGLIPRNNIVGRAWVRIWPLGRFGFLGSGPTLKAALALPLALPLPLLRRPRRRRADRLG